MPWDVPVIQRDQLVLFSNCLDDLLPADHLARQTVAILRELDWSSWEAKYRHEGGGRPPIHPKVMSGIVLYGLMRGVRSSRNLEDALEMRLDFLWIAEGRSIDHSTICRFRQSHHEELKKLFVQIVLVAKRAGILSLVELAVDGTKVLSNNNRSKTYMTAELRAFKQQLELRFDELSLQVDELDAQQDSKEKARRKKKLDGKKETLQQRVSAIQRAIEEVDRLVEKEEAVPKKIPTTDVESRVTKSKNGSFFPNYTPVTAVDPSSGMIASTEVIANCDEKSVLPKVLREVEEELGERPERVLADKIFSHSSNLFEMDKRGIALHSPIDDPVNNPAIREDITKPVAEEQRGNLPKSKKGQLTKAAFIYDEKRNSYFCPQGKELPFASTYNEKLANGTMLGRHRYNASTKDCAGCPLMDSCIKGESRYRRVSHDEAEGLRGQLRERMRTEEAKAAYDRRMQCERPFASIKHLMGVTQFLHRGLDKVRQEWHWAATAFNLQRLVRIFGSRAGPPTTATT